MCSIVLVILKYPSGNKTVHKKYRTVKKQRRTAVPKYILMWNTLTDFTIEWCAARTKQQGSTTKWRDS